MVVFLGGDIKVQHTVTVLKQLDLKTLSTTSLESVLMVTGALKSCQDNYVGKTF